MPEKFISDSWIILKRVKRVFKNPDGSERCVRIIEYLNPRSVTHVLDPQAGYYIKGTCRYKVITNDPINNNISKTQEMSMLELYDNHPWFFYSKLAEVY